MKSAQLLIGIVIVSIIVSWLFSGHVQAATHTPAQSIRVSPVIIPFHLQPGKTNTFDIKIENLTSSPIPIQASVTSFDSSDEENGITISDKPTGPSLPEWMHIPTPDFILDAHASSTVSINVTVPDRVPLGGYAAMVFFTPQLIRASEDVPAVVSKIGVLFLANIGVTEKPTNKSIQLVTIDYGNWWHGSYVIPFTLRVKNVALSYVAAKPLVRIKPLFGGIDELTLPEKVILPGKTRRWNEHLRITTPNHFIYNVHVRVSVGGGQMAEHDQYLVVLPPKRYLAAGALAVFSLAFFAYRKRVYTAFRVFFSKTT
jgi:hypothetical protein